MSVPYLVGNRGLRGRIQAESGRRTRNNAHVPRHGEATGRDLVIKPYWGGYEKDRIVGAMVDSDLQPYTSGMAAIGIVFLITSSILAIYSARQARQT